LKNPKHFRHQDQTELNQTNLVGAREVTLPLYPTLSETDVKYIVASVKQIISE